MVYVPYYGAPGPGTGWEDGPGGHTPELGAALDTMEAGILAAPTRWAPSTAYNLGEQVVSPNNDIVSAVAAHTSGATYTAANWHGAVFTPAGSGAVGDGVTDDTAALNAMYAKAAVGGGAVQYERGATYRTTNFLFMPGKVSHVGNGATILLDAVLPVAGGNSYWCVPGVASMGAAAVPWSGVMRDLTFRCTANADNAGHPGITMLNPMAVNGGTIENCVFDATACPGSRIGGIRSLPNSAWATGAVTAVNLSYVNCRATATQGLVGSEAFDISGGKNGKILNCFASGFGDDAIAVHDVDGFTISGNRVYSPDGRILIDGSRKGAVSGNHIERIPTADGTNAWTSGTGLIFFVLAGVVNSYIPSDIAVTGNVCVLGQATTGEVALNISGGRRITLSGNTVTNPLGACALNQSIGWRHWLFETTTIAAGSDTLSLPQASVSVASTAGFAAAGTVYVTTSLGVQTVSYTGLSGGNTFTGCTGGTGVMSLGGAVSDWKDPEGLDPLGTLLARDITFADNTYGGPVAFAVSGGVGSDNVNVVHDLPPYSLTASSTPGSVINAGLGNVFRFTLTGNWASAPGIFNYSNNQTIEINFIQDATGGRSYVWPTACKFAGGVTPVASTAANAVDCVRFRFDGTYWREISRAMGDHPQAAPAVTFAGPFTPAGTTSTTQVMAGLAVAFTPSSTGKLRVRIDGTVGMTTGTAPANGVAVVGTTFIQGQIAVVPPLAGASNFTSFSLIELGSGFALGTPYWFDFAFATGTAADAAHTGNVMVTVEECT